MKKDSFVAERASSFLAAVLAAFFVYNAPTLTFPTVQGAAFMLLIVGYVVFEYFSFKGIKRQRILEVFASSYLIAALLGYLFGQATIGELTSIGFFTSKAFIAFLASLPMVVLIRSFERGRK